MFGSSREFEIYEGSIESLGLVTYLCSYSNFESFWAVSATNF